MMQRYQATAWTCQARVANGPRPHVDNTAQQEHHCGDRGGNATQPAARGEGKKEKKRKEKEGFYALDLVVLCFAMLYYAMLCSALLCSASLCLAYTLSLFGLMLVIGRCGGGPQLKKRDFARCCWFFFAG